MFVLLDAVDIILFHVLSYTSSGSSLVAVHVWVCVCGGGRGERRGPTDKETVRQTENESLLSNVCIFLFIFQRFWIAGNYLTKSAASACSKISENLVFNEL